MGKTGKYNRRVINVGFHLNGSLLANYYLGVGKNISMGDLSFKTDIPSLDLSVEDYGDVQVDSDRFLDGICEDKVEITLMFRAMLLDVLKRNSDTLCVRSTI